MSAQRPKWCQDCACRPVKNTPGCVGIMSHQHGASGVCVGRLPHVLVTERGGVRHENGEPCGFLLVGNGHPTRTIYQACIEYDLRRRGRALELVGRAVADAARDGCEFLALWCRDGLAANDFWRAAGFILCGTRPGGRRRGRLQNRWVFPIPAAQGQLFPLKAQEETA